MPGWAKLNHAFEEEFGDRAEAEQPIMLALIVTDGEAEGINEFAEALTHAGKRSFAVVCIVGHGEDHGNALACFQRVAEGNEHVKVLSMDEITDSRSIAAPLLAMIPR